MTQTTQTLASGPGWRVADIVCTSAAGDPSFEEAHRGVCVAVVLGGTFTYRSRQGAAMMTPGALLLGNPGACFECGHDHGRGDRCLSFHFAPDHWDNLIDGLPGRDRRGFAAPKLPPLPSLAPLLADAEAALRSRDSGALEEVGVRLAGASALSGDPATLPRVSARDARRVAEAVRLIEADADRPIALRELAGAAATSPYHFLRVFRAVAGMTPHQFVLKTRLHRAAVRLKTSGDAVSAIAYDAGFNDLSTFNRRFRDIMGMAPTAWRGRGFRGRTKRPHTMIGP